MLLAGVMSPLPNLAAAPPAGRIATSAEVKAAALYNIVAFTNWPSTAFTRPTDPLVIGILGDGPVGHLILSIVRGEKWHGHPIIIEHFASPAAVRPCHVLYVERSARGDWPDVRRRLADHPVLAISDCDNFAADGGNVQLRIDRNRLRILVNLATTRANHLELSSNLLRLSEIVGPLQSPIPGSEGRFEFGPDRGWVRQLAADD